MAHQGGGLLQGLEQEELFHHVGMLWDSYKAMAPAELTVAGAWLGVLAFTFQIYFDFSGYSDIRVTKVPKLRMLRWARASPR